MARQIRPLAQRVQGARYTAPSAPSAPAVRSTFGSFSQAATSPASTASSLLQRGTTLGQPVGTGKMKGNAGTLTSQEGGIGAGLQTGKPGNKKKPTPRPNQSTPDPRDVDPYYWQNVQALRSQHTLDQGALLLERNKARADYDNEAARMGRDYKLSLRDLAESLAGTGGIYSGSHRRDRTEMGHDYSVNRSRLDSDFDYANKQRNQRGFDLDEALNRALTARLQEAHDFFNERQADTMAEGDPLNRSKQKPLGARIRARNRQIKTLKKRIDNTKNPHRRKKLRARLVAARKRRNQLVRKAKKNG